MVNLQDLNLPSSNAPISFSNPYCRQHLNTKKKRTTKKAKDEMKAKPKGNLT